MPIRIEGEIQGSAMLLVLTDSSKPDGLIRTTIYPCRGPAEVEHKRAQVLAELQEKYKFSVYEWKKEGSD
jgi:hypothetical protein